MPIKMSPMISEPSTCGILRRSTAGGIGEIRKAGTVFHTLARALRFLSLDLLQYLYRRSPRWAKAVSLSYSTISTFEQVVCLLVWQISLNQLGIIFTIVNSSLLPSKSYKYTMVFFRANSYQFYYNLHYL